MSLINFIKKIFPLKSPAAPKASPQVGPYQNMMSVWDDVVSGKHFNSFKSPHHERNFLQALHNPATLKMMAQFMADSTGGRVFMASAFIDGTPRFTWTPFGSKSSNNGEIGDILLVAKVYTEQDGECHYASILQAKVTNQSNDVDRDKDGRPKGKSTKKELALYEHWPPVKFKGQEKVYDLNVSRLSWPFDFSHFLAISSVGSSVTANATPAWVVNDAPRADSPFSVFDVPKQASGPLSFLGWLRKTVVHSSGQSQKINIGSPQSGLDQLVVDILANLVTRQTKGRIGYSGGVLIEHGMGNIIKFGTLQLGVDYFESSAVPMHLGTKTRTMVPGRITLPSSPILENGFGKPMLVLYLVVGPEGVERS